MLPQELNNKIGEYKSNAEIIKKTAEQVVKDFSQFGIEIRFSKDMKYVYDELFNQLSERILFMLTNDMDKLYNLLYRIDLREQQIRTFTSQKPEIPLHDAITGLILDRELQKVIIREMYKQNPESF